MDHTTTVGVTKKNDSFKNCQKSIFVFIHIENLLDQIDFT